MKHRARRHHSHRRHHRYGVRHSLVKLNPVNLRSIIAKDTLAIAAGAVAASLTSNLVVSKLNAFLPMVNTPLGRTAYNLVIPVAGAFIINRWAPNVAKGLVIGGLANAIGQGISATGLLPAAAVPATPAVTSLPAAATPAATSEYLGEYLGASEVADAVGAAFATNAWA